MRACLDCRVDISDRGHNNNAKRCVECAKAREKERKRLYYEANREKIAERHRRWREANPEKIAEQNRLYYEANPEKIAERKRLYREANREKIAEYYEANREKIAERKRLYHEANPEKCREHARTRRARKRNQLGIVTPGIEAILLERTNHRCQAPACGKKVGGRLKYHLDHIRPLALGGLHEDDNLQILCGHCNLSKSAKPPEEFAFQRGCLF